MKVSSLFIAFTLYLTFGFSQTEQLVLKSFIKKDSVLLRWAPSTSDLMIQGLLNGYTLERVEEGQSFENNLSAKQFIIAPFNERYQSFLTTSTADIKELAEFVLSITNNTQLSAESKNMAFFSLMLGASTNRELAKLLGVYYCDETVEKINYLYRVSINKTSIKSENTKVNVAELSQLKPLTILDVSAKPRLKQAYLSWEAVSLQQEYSAYWIERSIDSINFLTRNDLPYLFLKTTNEPNKTHCDFVDTSVVEGNTYYYRITGINHFAEKGKSSNIVKVYIPKSLFGDVQIDSISVSGFNRIVSGKFVPVKEKYEVEKFVLFRSDSILSGYYALAEQVYSNNVFSFQTKVPLESGDRYYYKVAAVGVDNDTTFSYPTYFFTLDQIPPSTPKNLTGFVNDSGIVRLAWKLNEEPDIRGYRVYRSNALHEEFVEVTKFFCTDSVFHDTLSLNNLTSQIYYSVAAVDLNYNNSKNASPIKLMKPDTIAPVPAIFTDFRVDSAGVHLKWNNSSSKDLKLSQLVREYKGTSEVIYEWIDTSTNFVDTTGVAGSEYKYTLITQDASVNKTESSGLYIVFEPGTRPGLTDIEANVNRELKQIELSWRLSQQEIYSIQIYRAKNEGGFILYKTLRDPKTALFIDKDLSMNNTYRYKIKVVYKSGVSSILSKEISVTY